MDDSPSLLLLLHDASALATWLGGTTWIVAPTFFADAFAAVEPLSPLQANPQPDQVHFLAQLGGAVVGTLRDVLPIVAVILFFQLAVLQRPIKNLGRLLIGMVLVLLGLACFLVGLEMALFPLGDEMARSLTSPELLGLKNQLEPAVGMAELKWWAYYWTYLFAFTIGVSTAFAEPSLMAVAMKAEEVSGKTISAFGLRVAVSLGVGVGVCLGTFRIVMGHPLPYYILVVYLIVTVQTWLAPKSIVPLAYDSGGVTTSTVTVPLIAALGLGLSSQIPGRSPMVDGFGMIALAAAFPIISVLGYAMLGEYRQSRKREKISSATVPPSSPPPPPSPDTELGLVNTSHPH